MEKLLLLLTFIYIKLLFVRHDFDNLDMNHDIKNVGRYNFDGNNDHNLGLLCVRTFRISRLYMMGFSIGFMSQVRIALLLLSTLLLFCYINLRLSIYSVLTSIQISYSLVNLYNKYL